MRRYLLGRLSLQERIDLENRYFSDLSLFEELTEVENDLIDCYVRGKLSDLDRQEFEQQYLNSPQRRARLQFARALTEISQEDRHDASAQKVSLRQRFPFSFGQASPRLRWGLPVGVMAMILAIGWLSMTHDRGLRTVELPRVTHGNPPSKADVIPSQNGLAPNNKSTADEVARMEEPQPNEFTLQLTPGLSRSGGAAKVVAVNPRTSWINLRLALDDDHHRAYVAVVETAEGKVILRKDGLKTQLLNGSRVLDLRISSHLIQSGDYVIRLSGTLGTRDSEEEVEVYSFRAVNR